MARPINTNECVVEDCEKLQFSKGWCKIHYRRMYTKGRLHNINNRGKHLVCIIEGCGVTKIKGHGLCLLHYRHRKYKFRTFGDMNIDDYNRLLEEQNNKCALCKKPESSLFRKIEGKIKNLAIDHCHKTGKIRGLLCARCNMVLGRVEEDTVLLQSMIDYLERHK